MFQITVVDGVGCQEEGGWWCLIDEKNVDYLTVLITKSYLVIPGRY
jgi:hypothetical protein